MRKECNDPRDGSSISRRLRWANTTRHRLNNLYFAIHACSPCRGEREEGEV
jgi:hypothetical protein